MKAHTPVLVITAAAAALLAGCAGPDPNYSSPAPVYSPGAPSYSQAQGSYYGVVDRIEVIRKGDSSNVAGTIIGGIVGGLIGHQIGGGVGNTAATIAGAAGGALIGNQVEGRSRGPNEAFRVSVRMDDGSFQTITQENITDLRTGDRVRVEGGNIFRV